MKGTPFMWAERRRNIGEYRLACHARDEQSKYRYYPAILPQGLTSISFEIF